MISAVKKFLHKKSTQVKQKRDVQKSPDLATNKNINSLETSGDVDTSSTFTNEITIVNCSKTDCNKLASLDCTCGLVSYCSLQCMHGEWVKHHCHACEIWMFEEIKDDLELC